MAIHGWTKALSHRIKSGQADLAPRTSRGGRATAARHRQSRAAAAVGGSRAGARSGGEAGAHIEVAADRGEQRQLKRRQRAGRRVAKYLSAAHPSPHAHAKPYPAASARDAHGGPSLRRL